MRTEIFALFIASAATSALAAGPSGLPDFASPAALQQAVAQDAHVSLVTNESGPALRMEAGTQHAWPGATFAFPEGLNLSGHGWLIVPVKNPGKEALRVNCRIDSRAKDAPPGSPPLTRTEHVDLPGGQSGDIRIPLVAHVRHPNLKKEDFFGMRGIPYFSSKAMHLENITSVILFVSKLKKAQTFEIGNLRLEGKPQSPDPIPEKPFPLIDEFGQFKHRDWPGKTHSLAEMKNRREEEARALASRSAPASWNRFGGWKNGPQLEATGWFRTAKHESKWYLVDPDGRLFFSLGIDCVNWGNPTSLDDRRHWFESLPPDAPAHRAFYGDYKTHMEKDYYFNRKVRTFNFHQYNVMRKYGGDWERSFAETCAARLPVWGVNTIGNWSASFIYSQRKVPYVAFVSTSAPPIEGSSGYWGKFHDVFHPDFKSKLRQRLSWENFASTRDDPWCIGYFVDNELSWGDEVSLARAALMSPPGQAAKQAFVSDVKAKYETIGALNKAWKTEHGSWDALLASTTAPDLEAARADLEAFNAKTADTYFRSIREVIKEFSPHQLYLGCRFAWGNPLAVQAAARHCDVVSFNAYTRDLAAKLPFMEQAGDKPYIIGEFHFGALDRGLFHTGLVPVKDQEDRAQAFTDYVNDCLAHPNIVGCHWFQYIDSPTTGRSLDGENYQIGFTDVCDTPYPEMVKASRAIGETLYENRSAK